MTYEKLEAKFAGFEKGKEQWTVIDATHPLWLWAGIAKSGLPIFMVSEIPEANSLRFRSTICIDVDVEKSTRGGWSLVFRCEDIRMGGVFKRLCYDFVEATRLCRDVPEGLNILMERFEDWRRLLQGKTSGRLTRTKQMGLFAELLFLEDCLGTLSPSQAVNAWRGPNKGAQDFLFPQTWAEVKAISKNATTVEISSLAQLAAELPGTLEVYTLEKAENMEEYKEAISLAGLVQRVRERIDASGEARQSFEEKLLLAGYQDKDEVAYTAPIVATEWRTYVVNGSFPRLMPDAVPDGVVDAHYQLALRNLAALMDNDKRK